MSTSKGWKWVGGATGAAMIAVIAVSCGGTGGGSGRKGNPEEQFVINSSNQGRLTLNVNPNEVDANKADRLGLVAQLTDSRGNPLRGIQILFTSDVPDIRFIPDTAIAVTDANGEADIIAVAGSTPTGTGAIVGTGAIFASPPRAFGLLAQTQVTLLDIGFIDADEFAVIPNTIDLVEPSPGSVVFFNIVGGTPPYLLKNEASGLGVATLSQHCGPGCTENSADIGGLCIGSPCLEDGDCNLDGSPSPAGVCLGPIKRCLASCAGTNCGGSRCGTDEDCNDGSPTPANVCQDSGQSIVYTILSDAITGTDSFIVEDSAGGSIVVTINVSFFCGNGVARGGEQCDLGDLRGVSCTDLGFVSGSLICDDECQFDTENCSFDPAATPMPPPTATVGATPTATLSATPTVTVTPTPTLSPTSTPSPGAAANLSLALLTNGAGDNGNGTLTTVIAATVTDASGNPVGTGTQVLFSIAPPTNGAVISSPSGTNTNPPCDVSNFESDTGVNVLNQPGVAHTCVTYPTGQVGSMRTITGTSGAASDMQVITLPSTPP